jgi:hypothetical protein
MLELTARLSPAGTTAERINQGGRRLRLDVGVGAAPVGHAGGWPGRWGVPEHLSDCRSWLAVGRGERLICGWPPCRIRVPPAAAASSPCHCRSRVTTLAPGVATHCAPPNPGRSGAERGASDRPVQAAQWFRSWQSAGNHLVTSRAASLPSFVPVAPGGDCACWRCPGR